MTSNEYDILFKMLMQVVDLMGAQTKQVGNVVKTVSNVVDTLGDLTDHCVANCEGKCGTSHEG